MSAALEVRDLGFGYGDVPVWEDVSFSVAAGEVAFLTGPNGAGKSTLFRCLAGWLEPGEGEVLLDGAPFTGRTRLAPGALAFVPDVPSFYDDLTAMEHVEFVLAANRADSARPRAERLLERFGLVGHERLLPSAYSRGMREKLALVLALALRPRVLLLDSLPMLVASLVSSALVLAATTGSLGANPVPAILLAWAMLLMLVLAAALDDPQRVRSVGTFRLTAFACGVLCVFVVGLVGLLGAMPALACAVAVDLVLVRSLR